jgi:putative transposase
MATIWLSVNRDFRMARFSRAAWYRRSRARDQTVLRLRIREIAHARPRFGYLRIWVLLRRGGWIVNHKRVRRLYRLEGLQVRMRVRRRKHIALHRGPAPVSAGPTERWSMDCVHDALADGRPFRVLTVVDQWSRHSPLLEPASRISGVTVSQPGLGSRA